MSFWSRLINVFRGDALGGEIREEFEAHIADSIADGVDPTAARRMFGPTGGWLDASRDVRVIPWLDSIRGDTTFAWRQFTKNPVMSVAAVLSIGLAIGACTSAFRLVDALLFRPLPVNHPERLFVLTKELRRASAGEAVTNDEWAYPQFREMRALVKDQAELIAVSYTSRIDLTYTAGQQMEKANQQYVSGWMFSSFGLRPALGRLFTEEDDKTPGTHPYAVLSYDYWLRRFGGDKDVIGRTFQTGSDRYQIIGIVQKPFTGTETGTMADIFIPTMMVKNKGIERSDYQWFLTFVMLKPGVAPAPVRDRLDGAFQAFLQETAKTFPSEYRWQIKEYLSQKLRMNSAAPGVSKLQADYGRSLAILSLLVGLVLAIACANVANLLSVNAAARSREMALRISIGAGRWRLLQLVLVESALLSFAATAAGGVFAWWAAPFVVSMISSPVAPTQLDLPADWRVLGFCALVAFSVAIMVSVPTAWQVSAMNPINALKGEGVRSRNRFMYLLVAVQAGFCFVVLFVGTLFVTTFERLSTQPTGFSADRILTLETLTPTPVKAVFWEQVAERLRSLPGVEAAALSEWPLMTGENWSDLISVNGAPPNQVECHLLSTSPDWREVMRIPLLACRDFRQSDRFPGSALVNDSFIKEYFGATDPLGKSFDIVTFNGVHTSFRVVGRLADARYRDMRGPMAPVAYLPFTLDYKRATFIVRTAGRNPLALANSLRQAISQARPDFHVSTIRTQSELIESHTVRERILAMLALFFGAVALLLAGVGLYGLLDYSVLQQRRDIGIRMALGAEPGGIAIRMAAKALTFVMLGGMVGFALGIATVRNVESLLYGVKSTEFSMLAVPGIAILLATFLASTPAAIRAARVDPARTLRSE